MKNLVKSMMFAALLVVGVSCEKQFEETAEVQSENHVTAEAAVSYEVSYEEALAKADALFAGIDGATTRAGSRRVKNHELFRSGRRFSRTASDDGAEAKFHIINYEDNAGFAMVAADKRATAVYAYSDTGNLDVNDAIEHTGFGVFMEGAIALYEDEVASMSILPNDTLITTPRPGLNGEYGDIPFLPLVQVGNSFYLVRYGKEFKVISYKTPMLNVKWHQFYPYNVFCPEKTENGVTDHCLVGCGPIAATQIMSYYEKPASYKGYNFDWDIMTNVSGFSVQSDASNLVARLAYEVGVAANADYGLSGTSAATSSTRNALIKFGYTASKVCGYDEDKIKNSLSNNRLICISGWIDNHSGHTWVIDGYEYKEKVDTYYYSYEPYPIFRRIVQESQLHIHCNWGWRNTPPSYCLSRAFKGYNNYLEMFYDIR